MKYSAVLFDLDGTLLYTLEDIRDALNRALTANGFSPRSLDEVCSFVGNGSARLVELSLPEQCNKSLEDKVLAEYRADYDAHCDVKTRPYDGIDQLLKELANRGVAMAVVSNKPDTAAKKLTGKHFPEIFSCTVGESQMVRRKPAPDTVLAAAKLLGFEREECLYVGDSEVDVMTAGNAGLRCVSACWGFRSREQLIEAGAETIIENPLELLNII